jgi:hypothetical protein
MFATGPNKSGDSYLYGIVDSVDLDLGLAVLSGVTVDYTALLSNGVAPGIGQRMGVRGQYYPKLGLLVAVDQTTVGW